MLWELRRGFNLEVSVRGSVHVYMKVISGIVNPHGQPVAMWISNAENSLY